MIKYLQCNCNLVVTMVWLISIIWYLVGLYSPVCGQFLHILLVTLNFFFSLCSVKTILIPSFSTLKMLRWTPTYKYLGSHHSHPYRKKKAKQKENQWLLWDASETRDCRAKHQPQTCRDGLIERVTVSVCFSGAAPPGAMSW